MYTIKEIDAKRHLAAFADLDGRWRLDDHALVQQKCNGIGAAWFPNWLRWLVGKVAPDMILVADIHDLEYEEGGGILDRWRSDWRFLRNGFRMARYRHRWRVCGQALRLWICLRIGGQAAFNWKKKERKK